MAGVMRHDGPVCPFGSVIGHADVSLFRPRGMFRAGTEPTRSPVRIWHRGFQRRIKDFTVRFSLLALGLATCLAAGCDRTPSTPVSTGGGPAFDPVAFFEGHTRSWGVIESRSGTPTERIVTDSHGERDGADRLHMVQHLAFQDGRTQDRDWVLWRTGPDRFDATANDMVGTAQGEVDGRMFHWQWVLVRRPGNALMDV